MFSHYFNYSSPNNKRSRLGNAKGEINKDQVYLIKKALTKFKNIVKNVPEDRRFKIEENEKIIDVVARIVELNNENQLGEALKILKPDQMLSRLPVTLAQLKAEFTKTCKWNQATIVFFVPFKKINQNNLQPFNQCYLKMEAIFMNNENGTTNEPHRIRLSLADKLNLQYPNENIALGN